MSEAKGDYETLINQYLRPDQLGSGFWGDQIGAGWWPLLEHFLQRAAVFEGLSLLRVKEKFGGLRIDWHLKVENQHHRRRLEALTQAAMSISSQTCELCGSGQRVGQTRGGWVKTICFACFSGGALPSATSLRVMANLRRDGSLLLDEADAQ